VRFDWGSSADERCDFESPVTLFENVHVNGCRLGRYTYVGHSSEIQNANIGRFCSIAPEVIIGLGAHPLGANISTSPAFYKRQSTASVPTFTDLPLFTDEYRLITIGHDVWIGARAIIKDGISIGNGAVIAAGAVVTRDIPPYAIAAGVPARVLRHRFVPEIIEGLQQLRWWDQDVDWLRGHSCDFMDGRGVFAKCGWPSETVG